MGDLLGSPLIMKSIKYSKYTGFDWDSLSLEDLLNKLSDYLLQSGFSNDRYGYPELGREHNLQDLRDAIMDALLNQGLLPDEMMEKLMEMSPEEQDEKLSELVDALIQKLLQEGYVSFTDESSSEQEGQLPGQGFEDLEPGQVRFELTNCQRPVK